MPCDILDLPTRSALLTLLTNIVSRCHRVEADDEMEDIFMHRRNGDAICLDLESPRIIVGVHYLV